MKTIKIILINVAILCLILVLVDPFLGTEVADAKTYRNLRLREYGPNRSLVLTPDANAIDTSLLDSKTYQLATNNAGFIVGPQQAKEAKCDILFFGGSTTECAYVDDSLRFPVLVGKAMGKTVGASAYGGNHSYHSLVSLLGAGLKEKPQTVVWMHAINDFSLLAKTGSYFVSPANRKVLFEEKQQTQPSFVQRWKKVQGALIMAAVPNLYKRIKAFGQKNGGSVDEWAGYRDLPHVPDSLIQQQFRASLSSFVAIAKAHQIEVVLMTQFNRISVKNIDIVKSLGGGSNYTPQQFVRLYASLNQIVREVAHAENVQCIDLDNAVPDNPHLFYDAVHLTNAGSRFVADLIAGEINEKRRLDVSSEKSDGLF